MGWRGLPALLFKTFTRRSPDPPFFHPSLTRHTSPDTSTHTYQSHHIQPLTFRTTSHSYNHGFRLGYARPSPPTHARLARSRLCFSALANMSGTQETRRRHTRRYTNRVEATTSPTRPSSLMNSSPGPRHSRVSSSSKTTNVRKVSFEWAGPGPREQNTRGDTNRSY